MSRLSVCAISFIIVASISACSFKKSPATNQSAQSENKNAPANAPAKSETTQPKAQAGELQPGQASGTYTAKGETVELKYAYAGRAERFGEEAMVILLTEKPIPSEAVAGELKDTNLLDGDKIRGLEYAIMKDGMWVCFHHSNQYQESGTMKIKDYEVGNDTVRGTDENDGGLSDERYARSVKFVATIVK